MSRRRADLQSPICVDASAWLASAKDRDQHHPLAQSSLAKCIAEGIQLETTNWTAFEALSMLKSRAGSTNAADL